MAKFYNPKLSVSSGEITPLLAARTDLAAYKNGAKTLTNGIVLPQGGFCNRPGYKSLGSPSYGARIVPFVVNTDIAYVLVFCVSGTIYVYNKDGLVTTVSGLHKIGFSGSGAEEVTALIRSMTYVQSADIMLCFEKHSRPQIIKRLSETEWTCEDFVFKYGPYQAVNSDNSVTVTLSSAANGLWQLQSSEPLREDGTTEFFSSSDIGSPFYYEFYAPAFSALLDVADGGEWVRSPLYGNISMTTEGAWQGTLTLSRRGQSELNYSVISSFTAGTMVNNTYPVWAYTGTEDEIGASYKINATVTSPSSGYQGVRIRIEASGGIANYNFTIKSVINDTTIAFVALDNPDVNERVYVPPVPSSTFAFGSFGSRRGYPGVCTFHQERLVLANSLAEPTTIWMSKPASWDNFDTTIPTEDSDSIQVVLATNQVNEIRAMTSKEDLLIFTAGAEFVAQTGSSSDVFTPSSVVIVPTGYRGCYPLGVLNVGSSTLFVQKHGNVVRSLGYQLDTDGYNTSELSVLSQHLFEGKKVVAWDYQQDPWSVVWVLLDDGTCLAFTYIQEHQVAGWAKEVFGNFMDDICCIPGDGQDDVFFLTYNNIVPNPSCMLFMMNHREDKNGQWDVSTYRDYLGSSKSIMTFESLELEQEQAQGTVQGRFKQIPKVCIRLFRTTGLKAGIITENSTKIDQLVFPGDEDSLPAYKTTGYTGDVYVNVPGDKGRQGRLQIVADNNSPITVLGVWEEVHMEDDA